MIVSKILFNSSRWPLLIAYALFLYVTFSLPLPDKRIPEAVFQANDKVLHFLDFLLLALLAFRTFRFSSQVLFCFQAGRKAVLFSVLYATFLELVQRTVPGREASLGDWMTDAAGVLVASGIFRISRLTPSS